MALSERWRAGVWVLLAVAAAAAFLLPRADRGVLVAQGVGQLLTRDHAAFVADPGAAGFFAALRALDAADAERVLLSVRVDGAPDARAELVRAFGAGLGRYEESHRAGRPRLEVAGVKAPVWRTDPRTLVIALDVETRGERVALSAELGRGEARRKVRLEDPWRIPGRASLLPPLIAVGVALATNRALLALFVGILAGAIAHALPDASSTASGVARGALDVFDVYLRREATDSFRAEIIGFVVALVAMVGVMSRSGGVQGLIQRLLRFARDTRSALMLTYGMGLLIFFDDYANCMLVGSTMRPLTDRLRISREKLAYVVDSTAAPLAGISLVSTWVAFEVSVYSAQLPAAGISDSGYAVFVQTLPYRCYSILTLCFVPMLIWLRRDFGPMARAEQRARTTGQLVRPGGRPPISDDVAALEPAAGAPRDWRFAAVPLALTLFVTVARIFSDGGGAQALRDGSFARLGWEGWLGVLLAGSGAGPILWGALSGLTLAVLLAGTRAVRAGVVAGLAAGFGLGGAAAAALEPALGPALGGAVGRGVCFAAGAGLATWLAAATAPRAASGRFGLGWGELRRAGFASARTLGFAVVLLFEAWMIGAVCQDLSTADYLVGLLTGAVPPLLLPLLLFLASGVVAFATGSSWSTMSILLPNVVGLAASLGAESPLGGPGLVLVSIGAVLEGAIFGDHCSPISDTTVLSSVASASDHIDHVRTQAPYALATAGAAALFGFLPVYLLPGLPPWVGLVGGALALLALLLLIGRRVDAGESAISPIILRD